VIRRSAADGETRDRRCTSKGRSADVRLDLSMSSFGYGGDRGLVEDFGKLGGELADYKFLQHIGDGATADSDGRIGEG
jgi:hypothetical protein